MPRNLFAGMMAASWLAAVSVGAQTNVLQFQSGPERTALFELYTSEGCSSCPPAEAWLSGLTTSPRLWKDFAPVAWHVDYWDYPGWKDTWSDAAFTERQRRYAQLWHSENIYTPEWVLNGKEWHKGFAGKTGPKSDGTQVGVLTVVSGDRKLWQVSFSPAKDSGARYEIHAARLVGCIISDVQAGENRGRQLQHDFAVVNLSEIDLTHSSGAARGSFILSAPKFKAGKTSALTVWVTRAGEMEPVQATGGWLVAPETK